MVLGVDYGEVSGGGNTHCEACNWYNGGTRPYLNYVTSDGQAILGDYSNSADSVTILKKCTAHIRQWNQAEQVFVANVGDVLDSNTYGNHCTVMLIDDQE